MKCCAGFRSSLLRLKATFLLVTVLTGPAASAQDVHIGVLGLFHPQQLTVTAPAGAALAVHAGAKSFVLESSSATGGARFRRSEDAVILQVGSEVIAAASLRVTGRDGNRGAFVLAVPGKISRRYVGTLEVNVSSGALLATVSMDLETAVASVVAAETTADVPLEAIKAQAVAARSYFVASPHRHIDFDFCDTTHCQFLREPPAREARATKAAAETRGMVITYESHPFGAMYTRSCGGRTRTPAEVRLPMVSYPYYSVDCKFCREHPAHWQSRVHVEDVGALRIEDEPARLAVARRIGWDAVQSNDFTMKREGNQVTLRGTGQGHGIGLCQSGANAMAREGASFREILAHYYPNTTILNLARDMAVLR